MFQANLAFSFYSGISITTTCKCIPVNACKCIPYAKYENRPIEIPVSLFFHNIVPNLAELLPHRLHPLYFFLADFQWNVQGDSIDINNLCCNPAVLKKR